MANQISVENSTKTAQNLPFYVVAVPQSNISKILDTELEKSPKPVNIKIRIKNNQVITQSHEIISVPKLTTGPKKVRLVNSDQTILSFNLLMEKENVRTAPKKPHHKFLQLFKPSVCFNNKNDDDIYAYAPGSSNAAYKASSASYLNDLKNNILFEENFALKKNPSPLMISKTTVRTPTFSGKCKPGGCLDPPFGEDKYIYKPTSKMITFNQHDFTDEKRNEDSSNTRQVLKKPDRDASYTPKKNSIEEIYSHSLITYPPTLSCSDNCFKEKTQNKNENVSALQTTVISTNEFSDTYFMPPKIQKIHNKDAENQKREIMCSNSYDRKLEKLCKNQNIPTSLFSMPTNQTGNQDQKLSLLCPNNKGNISDTNFLADSNISYTETCNENKDNIVDEISSENVMERKSSFCHNNTISTLDAKLTAQVYQPSQDDSFTNNLVESSVEEQNLQAPVKSSQIKIKNNEDVQSVPSHIKSEVNNNLLNIKTIADLSKNNSVNLLKKYGESLQLNKAELSQHSLEEKLQSKEVINLLPQNKPPLEKNIQNIQLKESDHSHFSIKENLKSKGEENVFEGDGQTIIQLTDPNYSQFALQDKTKNEKNMNLLQKDLQLSKSLLQNNGQSIQLIQSVHSQFTLQEKISTELKNSIQKDFHKNIQPFQNRAQSVQLQESDYSQLFIKEKIRKEVEVNLSQANLPNKEPDYLQRNEQEKIQNIKVRTSTLNESQENLTQFIENIQSIQRTESDLSQFTLEEKTQNGKVTDFLQKDSERSMHSLLKNAQSLQLKDSDHSQVYFFEEKIQSSQVLQSDLPSNMLTLQKNGQMNEFDHSTLEENIQNKEEYLQQTVDVQNNKVSTTSAIENGAGEILKKDISDIIKNQYSDHNNIPMLFSTKVAREQNGFPKSVEPSDSLITEVMNTKQSLSQNKINVVAALTTDFVNVHVTNDIIKGLNNNLLMENEYNGTDNDSSSMHNKVKKEEIVDEKSLEIEPQVKTYNNKLSLLQSANTKSLDPGGSIIQIDKNLKDQNNILVDLPINPLSYQNLSETKYVIDLKNEDTSDLILPEKEDVALRNENSLIEINFGFHAIENRKNEILIKSFDTLNLLENNPSKITVIKSSIRKNDSGIRIPINRDIDLMLQIKNSVDKETISKMVIDGVKKEPSDESKRNRDILCHETLEFVHEKLFPLETIIRNLKQEADDLTKQQGLLREIINGMKTESVKAIPPRTTCNCNKYFM